MTTSPPRWQRGTLHGQIRHQQHRCVDVGGVKKVLLAGQCNRNVGLAVDAQAHIKEHTHGLMCAAALRCPQECTARSAGPCEGCKGALLTSGFRVRVWIAPKPLTPDPVRAYQHRQYPSPCGVSLLLDDQPCSLHILPQLLTSNKPVQASISTWGTPACTARHSTAQHSRCELHTLDVICMVEQQHVLRICMLACRAQDCCPV